MMEIKYEYKGHKCPFKAKVWDECDARPSDISRIQTVVLICGVYFLTIDSNGRTCIWPNCEPITEPKVIPWTAKTAPFPLALRKKCWNEGEYMLFDVGLEGPFSCSTNSYGGYYYSMTFRDLAEPDSEWETRDGKPCGEVVE